MKIENLRIIADDLGLAESVNDGIIFLLREAKINGTSLMANGAAFDHAITGLTQISDLGVGIHLVLVEEKSLLNKEQIPTLVNRQGFFYKNHRIFFIRYILGLIKKKDIAKEIEVQIQKILGAGLKPQFINSHQHLHLLPGILDIIISLAKKHGISYIRIVHEPLRVRGGLLRKAQLCFLMFLSKIAKKKIIQNGLRCNDFFVGFINAGKLGIDDINLAKKLQNEYPNKFIELGCHPGFESRTLVEEYRHWRYNWQKELKILKQAENYDEKK